jgi:N-methylhydantoinase A
MNYRLGIDVGGTFTDFILVDEKGRISLVKVGSSSEKPSEVIREGLKLLSRDIGLTVKELLSQCNVIIYGTTVGTNALIKRTFSKTGLMYTEGFRDILEIRRGHKEKRYNWLYPKPEPLIQRYLRLPVEERITRDGEIHTPLNPDDVCRHIEKFKKEGVEAIAVCFLWSFKNPVHENMVRAMIEREFPEAYVGLSSEILPEIGEYNRFSTTAVSCCIQPIVARYIDAIEETLKSAGYEKETLYMEGSGGIISGAMLKQRPASCVLSGPAGAPGAGLYFGRLFGHDNIITIDMGGTSFDATLLEGGSVEMERSADVAGYRVAFPMVKVNTLGAGGGSIAWIDSSGMLRVGPQSAEADPGPACYGTGGEEPTVTDVDVVLGYFNPSSLLGGRLPINRKLAEKAIEQKIAGPTGTSVQQASLGIFNLVNTNMVNGIKEISIERGYDTRDFVLVGGGGCGPGHAGRIAKELEMRHVLIPKVAPVLCAFGSVVTDIRHDYTISYLTLIRDLDVLELDQLFERLEASANKDLASENVLKESMRITRSLYMRYVREASLLPIFIPSHKITKEEIAEIEDAFHRVHERLYTFADRESEIELVTVGVTVYAVLGKIQVEKGVPVGQDASGAKLGERMALFEEYGDYIKIAVFDGERLQPGNMINGPAIIEEPTTTIVVFPGWRLELSRFGVYVMTLEGSSSGVC